MNLWQYEEEANRDGLVTVAGIDEAGRGPLAGPVVAACVVLPLGFDLTGIDDSKKLTAAKREAAYARIVESAVMVGVGIAEAQEIDSLNILRATHWAMRRALSDAQNRTVPHLRIDTVLVDGLPVPDLHKNCRNIVKGDSLSASIAAASIIAKVTRDKMMDDYHNQYPDYGFAIHKGYPTRLHLRALETHGVCPIHRQSFAPVRKISQLK